MIECKMEDLNAYLKYRGDYHRSRFWIQNGKFREIEEFKHIRYNELMIEDYQLSPKQNERENDRREMELNMLHQYYDENIRPITDNNTLMSIILNGDGKLKEFIKDQRKRKERLRLTQVRKEHREFHKRTLKPRYAWI
jgi:hypothetical protein